MRRAAERSSSFPAPPFAFAAEAGWLVGDICRNRKTQSKHQCVIELRLFDFQFVQNIVLSFNRE